MVPSNVVFSAKVPMCTVFRKDIHVLLLKNNASQKLYSFFEGEDKLDW